MKQPMQFVKTEYFRDSALKQINACSFQCDGGPLSKNTAWKWLEERLAQGPKFWPGQWVYYLVQAEIQGIMLHKWEHFCITAVFMNSNSDGLTWEYALSTDPPAAYHYGKKAQFQGIKEQELATRIQDQ